MPVSKEQKQAIVDQRLGQLEQEEFQHELNLGVMEDELAEVEAANQNLPEDERQALVAPVKAHLAKIQQDLKTIQRIKKSLTKRRPK